MRRWGAALAVVAVGWLLSPSAVPVYDGVGFPDQPYRFVGRTPAPSPLTVSVPVSGGAAGAVQGQTSESGPQAKVDLAPGTFRSSAPSVAVTVSPVAAGAGPTDGTLDSNAYRVTAPGATVSPDTAQGFVYLRAAVMTSPSPVVEVRTSPGGPWTRLPTTRVGTDVLGAPFRALGDYAVVRLPGSDDLARAGGLTGTRVAVLAGGLLLLVGVTVLAVRRPGSRAED